MDGEQHEKAEENLKYANAAFEEGLLNSTELFRGTKRLVDLLTLKKIDANIDARLCELLLKTRYRYKISKLKNSY